jgi:hypothetical protein
VILVLGDLVFLKKGQVNSQAAAGYPRKIFRQLGILLQNSQYNSRSRRFCESAHLALGLVVFFCESEASYFVWF